MPYILIVEKDLWVVLTLQALFDRIHDYNAYQALTFKGGTSLSKAYQIIERFSEDIDITIDRKFLGLQASDEELKALSRRPNRTERVILAVATFKPILAPKCYFLSILRLFMVVCE